ncbi:aspartate kinase [Lenzites betulinus]|nr:aspartate kinase [Lenzites betulinus]
MHQNTIDPAAKWLVQKYGGTSVGKFAAKIAQEIIPEYLDQHKVAIVCSARSGSTKALGTTNLLLKAASEALQRNSNASETPGIMSPNGFSSRLTNYQSPFTSPGKSSPPAGSALALSPINSATPAFSVTVDLIRSEHIAAARTSVRNPEILAELEGEIDHDCETIRSFLFATQVIDEISPRSRDSIIGFGERLGCKLVAAVLRDRNIDAEFVSLENIVPLSEGENFSDSETLGQDFYDRVADVVAERIRQCGNRVPVVTGFFGPIPGSLLRQVGRGYTDLLAALLAAGLGASELQIWKEVDGIFTADPRKVPTARLIPMISPEEAAELTYYGSEVVHPFTMDQVIRRKIPIRIKNVENPSGGGTVIHPDHDTDAVPSSADAEYPPVILTSKAFVPFSSPHSDKHSGVRQATAATIKEHIIVLNINSNRKNVSHGFLATIFGTLDRFGVVVDLISTSEVYVSMAIEENLDKKVLERVVRELRKSGTVTVIRDMAILSLVGKSMRNMIGISGRMFTTLGQGNVNIEMISQGANEINISCVIDGRDAVKALNLIHQSCLQVKPEGERGRVGPWLF